MSLANHKRLLAFLGGIIIILGAVSFHNIQKGHSKTTQQSINLYTTNALSTLDISKSTDSVSNSQLTEVDEGLYRLDANSKPVNALAAKTRISKDGKNYTIDLKHDGRWSNGDPVTAQDFVYSWRRTLNPKTKSEFTYVFSNIKNADQVAAGKLSTSELGVKAVGKYQLKIELSKPASYFTKLLASSTFYPINRKSVQKFGNKYGTSAATTCFNGPFTLENWTGTNDAWVLKKNPKYRDRQAVKLNKINYKVMKSNSNAYNMYQAHKFDIATLTGEQNVANKSNPALKTLSAGSVGFIQYNQKNKVAANKNLRLAISQAIDRKQLTQKILQNGSIPAKSFAVQNMAKNPKDQRDFADEAYFKNTVDYQPSDAQTNFAKAQKGLNQKQINLTITCGDDDNTHQMAEFIQSQLTGHLKGLNVEIQALPFPSMLAKVSQGHFQLNLTAWNMDFADPDQSLTILTSHSNSNMGHFKNKTFDNLMTKADGTDALKDSDRYNDLLQAAKIVAKEQAVTPLYEGRTHVLVNPRLKGVVFNNFSGAMNFRTAYVK
ncbi:peptide ABC transporter substrate-binding protein [Pediococcus argentinicus]|uniref:peptide ABC transporter substrate-binding protein n=1 Tax=Pediococcus argentinicus TaxID=480391 RepID=UPI00338FBB4E